jgi:hypothetical protein
MLSYCWYVLDCSPLKRCIATGLTPCRIRENALIRGAVHLHNGQRSGTFRIKPSAAVTRLFRKESLSRGRSRTVGSGLA